MEPKTKKSRAELVRALKFALFSASAGLIQAGSFALLDSALRLPYWISYLTALILSVLWNFTFNRKFTFHSAANVPIAMAKVAGFYLVFTPLSTWAGARLEGAGVNAYVVLIGTMLVNFVTEFLFDRFFVFGKSIDTDGKA